MEMPKKLHEGVNTIYKVTGVIYPDVEDTEEFDNKEDAMNYAQEQIVSGDYDEVIASEVTIDEDGYEDETILLDEQGESKSNVYYALHTFYEDEPDEIDIDSLETFETEEEAMKRAKELEAKGLRVVINIEGDESAGWDYEDEYSDIGDEIYSTPYTMEEKYIKSKDKYSVLREALDRLDREDSRGKKTKIRAQIRNLRNKLKESYSSSDLFEGVVRRLRKEGYIVDIAKNINQVYQEYCYQIASARKRTPEDDPNYTGKLVEDDRYLDDQGLFGVFDHYDETIDDIHGTEICVGEELFPANSRTVSGICQEIKEIID